MWTPYVDAAYVVAAYVGPLSITVYVTQNLSLCRYVTVYVKTAYVEQPMWLQPM